MTTKSSIKKSTKRAPKKATKAKRGAKKSTKKSAAKSSNKTTVARKATKQPSKKASAKSQSLMYAEGPACFWVHEGPVLTSLVDLEAALREMNEDLYRYHTTGEQNDFAEWVESVLSDSTCANALRKARKPSTAASAVRRRLTVYEY